MFNSYFDITYPGIPTPTVDGEADLGSPDGFSMPGIFAREEHDELGGEESMEKMGKICSNTAGID